MPFLWSCLITLSDAIENSCNFLNQSETNTKTTVACSHAFSGAYRRLNVFAFNFDWLTVMTLVLAKNNKLGNSSSLLDLLRALHFSDWTKAFFDGKGSQENQCTLNSIDVSKAFSASLLACIASDRAFEALCRAISASRFRWPAVSLARVAVSMAIVKLTFACSP